VGKYGEFDPVLPRKLLVGQEIRYKEVYYHRKTGYEVFGG